MRINTKNIVWFTEPKRDVKLTATVGRDERLKISEEFQRNLPENIRLGFDDSSRTLFIAEATDRETRYKKHRWSMVYGLAKAITDTGLKLPVCFEFTYDDIHKWWVGTVLLRRRDGEYNVEQLLALYKPLADRLFTKMGKTMPREDRRQVIRLAFCEAAREYTQGCGDLEEYLTEKTNGLIKPENSQYVKQFQMKSFDEPLVEDEKGLFTLHSCMTYDDENFDEVENKMMEEQFIRELTEEEYVVFGMLKDRYDVKQIAESLGVSLKEVEFLAKSIGLKREYYYSA